MILRTCSENSEVGTRKSEQMITVPHSAFHVPRWSGGRDEGWRTDGRHHRPPQCRQVDAVQSIHRGPGCDRGRSPGRHARSAFRRGRVERTAVLAGGHGRDGAGRPRPAQPCDPDPGRGGGGRERCRVVPRRRRGGGASRGLGDRPVSAQSTTRDAIDTPLSYQGRTLVFIDTAGLRKRSKVEDDIEFYATLRTSQAIERADVCVLVVDAKDGMHVQDLKIANDAWEQGAAIIVAVNKWDLIEEKETNTAARGQREVEERAPFLQFIPFLYLSAKTGQRVPKLLELILEVAEERAKRVPTDERLRAGRYARPRLPDRRDADELHRRQGREGHRPARARLEQPRGDQRVPRARLEVRDPRRSDRHGQGRRPGRDPRALVQRARVLRGRAGTGGGARPHLLPVRPLPRRQGRGDGSGDVPGPRPTCDRDLARPLGCHSVALRVRVGRVPRGGRAASAVGPAHGPRAALHVLGERGPGAADYLLASAQYRALAAGDGESVPHEKGRGWVKWRSKLAARACRR